MEPNKDILDEQRLMLSSELGKLLGRASKSINVDVNRRPETLPPRFLVPGTRKNQWRVKDVRDWMNAMAELMAEKRVKEREFAQKVGLKETVVSRPFHLGARHASAEATARMKSNQAAE